MQVRPRLIFCVTAVLAVILSPIPNSYAAKTGQSCKKVNAKSWDGNKPIVCKKVNGKLIWTRFASATARGKSPAPVSTTTSSSQTIQSGQWLVGSQVQPGTYRTLQSDCYWERQRGLSGSTSDIIDNGSTASNGGYVTISSTDKAFLSKCSWTLQSGITSNPTPSMTPSPRSSSSTPSPIASPKASDGSSTIFGVSSGIPKVGRFFYDDKGGWSAWEITNDSPNLVHTYPSYRLTVVDKNGRIVTEGTYDFFPLLLPGETKWLFVPHADLSLLGYGSPDKMTLKRDYPSGPRPSNPSEWPEVKDIRLNTDSGFGGLSGVTALQFKLTNKSKSLILSSESTYYYFCLDSSNIPIYAGIEKLRLSLTPGGSTTVSWISKLKPGQCASIAISFGPYYR